MANFSYKTHFLTLVGALLLATLAIGPERILGQNCGCSPSDCCSKYGYCGTGGDYCGAGCQSGPCYGGGGGGVASIVTNAFFSGIANKAGENCEGKGFYTRAAFLNASGAYPRFGTTGSSDDQKREIAAAFAHFTHETRHFCDKKEINGQATGFDAVAKDSTKSFKTGLSFWMNKCHSIITSGQGFGATIRAVNGVECNGGNPATVKARVGYYTAYCSQLGVDPGTNLTC